MPIHHNPIDSGIFVMQIIKCLALGRSFELRSDDVDRLLWEEAFELIFDKLIPIR